MEHGIKVKSTILPYPIGIPGTWTRLNVNFQHRDHKLYLRSCRPYFFFWEKTWSTLTVEHGRKTVIGDGLSEDLHSFHALN